jgi:hypothetical protein
LFFHKWPIFSSVLVFVETFEPSSPCERANKTLPTNCVLMKSSAKDSSDRFETLKLKATDSRGATLMSVNAPIFSDPRW